MAAPIGLVVAGTGNGIGYKFGQWHDVAWFEFRELCDGPRSQNDYIELGKIFHAVLISNVEQMGVSKDDIQIGIEMSRRSHVSCTTAYVLPGGRRYRPSAAYGEPPDLPFWRWD